MNNHRRSSHERTGGLILEMCLGLGLGSLVIVIIGLVSATITEPWKIRSMPFICNESGDSFTAEKAPGITVSNRLAALQWELEALAFESDGVWVLSQDRINESGLSIAGSAPLLWGSSPPNLIAVGFLKAPYDAILEHYDQAPGSQDGYTLLGFKGTRIHFVLQCRQWITGSNRVTRIQLLRSEIPLQEVYFFQPLAESDPLPPVLLSAESGHWAPWDERPTHLTIPIPSPSALIGDGLGESSFLHLVFTIKN